MKSTFSHTIQRDTIDKAQLSALLVAMLGGMTIQWKRNGGGTDWHTYNTKTDTDKADTIADIIGDSSASYRAVPREFLALWNSEEDHKGIKFNTALDWWLAGNNAK